MDSTNESPQQRYRIKVHYKRIGKREADMKKRVIVGVLTQAMRRQHALELAEGEEA
jgi:hypothetical protein